MKNNAISRMFLEREFFKIDPKYQRNSDIWDLSKKQLFIDSILNEYDIPKLYFDNLSFKPKKKSDEKFEYAIIDGKQRLEAIFDFMEGKFKLSEYFIFLKDPSINLKNLSYIELGEKYPRLKNKFDTSNLPIIEVETDDEDLIEEMFSRLNEAVPLNSAESRNAIGGSMAQVIREVGDHIFFTKKLKFKNKRYQYREVAARLLFIEYSLKTDEKIFDTKKMYLDEFVRKFKKQKNISPEPIKNSVIEILNRLIPIFKDEDPLLSAQGVIPIYYLVMRNLVEKNIERKFTHKCLQNFLDKVAANKKAAQINIANADYDLLNYDKMTIQGTNDASSIKERTRMLTDFFINN